MYHITPDFVPDPRVETGYNVITAQDIPRFAGLCTKEHRLMPAQSVSRFTKHVEESRHSGSHEMMCYFPLGLVSQQLIK